MERRIHEDPYVSVHNHRPTLRSRGTLRRKAARAPHLNVRGMDMSRFQVFYSVVLVIISAMTDLAHADQSNLFTWFQGGESTIVVTSEDSATLPGPLAEFVYSRFGIGDPRWHLPREDIFKCYGDLNPNQYSYSLKLRDDGIGFWLPLTSNGSCGEEIRATFKELTPFMNKQGLGYVTQINSRRNKK